ncbi:MAG: DUF4065 domain-containing protein [Gammaproteobacteria bacterium]|nr:DUF4065 domain-containing protein [Gammaproteobacteria bacterium]
MKLIKLIYFAYGWHLAIVGKRLINEPVCAWRYGPVIESVYQDFKKYGNGPITEETSNRIDDKQVGQLMTDEVALALLDKIWDVYGVYDGIQLSNLTHEPDSPWYEAWHAQKGKSHHNFNIDDQLIKAYFDKRVQ